jgi:abortive infection bacteriophage resistance protein
LGLFQQADEELWKNWLGLARAISYQTAYPNHSLETLATWNQRLSSSLLCDISHVELGIRNVISQALQSSGEKRGLRGHWLQDSSCYLSAIGGQEFDNHIEAAKRRVLKTKSEALFDDIVAELSLGFWLTFLGKRYVAIHGDLASSLAGLKDRNVRRLSPLANRFRALRNRIAHHHRIFHRDLNRDW